MAIQDDYTRITLRIPKDLHARLAGASEETSKSMNAEIIARLEESFSGKAPNADALEARMTALELKSMMSELTLSGAVLELLQRIPTENTEERAMVRKLTSQILDQISAMGDLKQRFNELLKKLPTK